MTIEELEDLIREKMGIKYLRPYQTLILTHILENVEEKKKTNILCTLPTGSGKSLCFMAPLLFMDGITILIYPLIALMADQERRFITNNMNCIILKGGISKEERKERVEKVKNGEVKIIITNVEMLLFLIKNKELDSIKISTVVIDEVHTIISWGRTFRPSLLEIDKILSFLKPDNIFAFTATLNKEMTKSIIDKVFNSIIPYIVHASSDRENIFYHAHRTLNINQDILSILKSPLSRPAVVFCHTREETEKRAKYFKKIGYKTMFYHSEVEKSEKERIEKSFFSSESGILFATIAYGMGVSKDNIRTIIHTYMPQDAPSYLQESGRGGRDGEIANSYVLYREEEKSPISYIYRGHDCIRRQLLEKMNEESENRECLGCSNCVKDNFKASGESEIIAFINYFGFSKEEKMIKRLIYPSLLNHGIRLKSWKEEEVKYAITVLEKENKITKRGKYIIKKLSK